MSLPPGQCWRGLVVGLGLSACSCTRVQAPREVLTSERAPDAALTVATYADVGTMDPATSSDGVSAMIFHHIYASLMELDDQGQLTPYLAESYAAAADHRSYTFRLRAGLRFHDGAPLTAEAVVASFERAAGPAATTLSDGAFDHVVGLDEFRSGKAPHIRGLVVLDERSFRVDLKRPDIRFPSLCTLSAMRPVCPSAPVAGSASFSPCGAGAYRVQSGEWLRGREIRLRRTHEEPPPFVPKIEQIRWLFQTSTNTQRLMLLRGELDIVSELSYVDDMALRAIPAWRTRVQFEPAREAYGEIMNTEIAPFNNVHLRRAVSLAIDRRKFERIKPGSMVGTAFPLPASVLEEFGDVPCQRYDLSAALQEMALAGYPYDPATGRGGYPSPIPYLVYAQGVAEYSAQLVASELAKVGIHLELRVLSYQAYLAQAQRRGESPMSFGGWATDVPDATAFLKPLFHSGSIADEDSTNSSYYRNPQVDADLDLAAATDNTQVRSAALRRVIRTVCDDAPWAFTFGQRASIYTQSYVHGFVPHPTSRYWFLRTELRGATP